MIVVVFTSPLKVKRFTQIQVKFYVHSVFLPQEVKGGGVEKIQSLKEYMIACCLHFSTRSQVSFKVWVGFCVHSCFPVYLETAKSAHMMVFISLLRVRRFTRDPDEILCA